MRVRTIRGRHNILIVALILAILPSFVFAQQQGAKSPGRSIAVFTEYSGITVVKGDSLNMDLLITNKGLSPETIGVKIVSIPKAWKATIKGGAYSVSSVYVDGGQTKKLALNLEPQEGVKAGDVVFSLKAVTKDGSITAPYDLTVKVVEPSLVGEEVKATSSYPVLRGQADSDFEFSMDLFNGGQSEKAVNLSAVGPENWFVTFQPVGETKKVSGFLLKGGQSESVRVQVTPAKGATEGEYPVLVTVEYGGRTAEVALKVVLTGVYRVDAGTTSGLLSIDAMPDKVSTFSLFVKNTGSAVTQDITFDVLKPENWAVSFNPQEIRGLEAGEAKQVEVMVKPDPRALVGDYAIDIRTVGKYAVKNVEMRVIVRAPTTWGWIGIGLIIFVIAGLSFLFLKLGRR